MGTEDIKTTSSCSTSGMDAWKVSYDEMNEVREVFFPLHDGFAPMVETADVIDSLESVFIMPRM